jgi:uncharacterized protein DUF4258
MASLARVPADPLPFIQRCVAERRLLWTYHVNLRLQGRSIAREAILSSTARYEIIERYPEDKYLPSYLVLIRSDDDALHVLFAVDVEDDNVRIIAAYRPTLDEWELDLKVRRVKP